MVCIATKMERKFKRKGNTQKNIFNQGSPSSWRLNLRREEVAQTMSFVGAKAEPYKIQKKVPIESKGKFDTQHTRNCYIKYFRCLGAG